MFGPVEEATPSSGSSLLRSTYPNGLGLREHLGGDMKLAFIFGYKAAHKLTVEDLKLALPKEDRILK